MEDMPDCMKAENLSHARVYKREDRTYVIRDVWSDGGHECRKGLTLTRCEYAVWRGDRGVEWVPCVEGVELEAIEPAFKTMLLDLNRRLTAVEKATLPQPYNPDEAEGGTAGGPN